MRPLPNANPIPAANAIMLGLLAGTLILLSGCNLTLLPTTERPNSAAALSSVAESGTTTGTATSNLPSLPHDITLPPGFSIHLYADNVPNARSMSLSPNGTLFVGTRTKGDLYAVVDADRDRVAAK